jgi:DNA-binding LacI/PurR family transcriptional regulator
MARRTINQDTESLARAAIDSVIERLDEGRSGARQIIVAPRLIVRESTAPPSHRQ